MPGITICVVAILAEITQPGKHMRILYLTGRELAYPRNEVLFRAFQRLGAVVEPVGGGPFRSLLLRSLTVGLRALPRLLRRRYDLVFVGFYGHLLVLPVGMLAKGPVLFDAFVSTYDTLCFDREVCTPHSFLGRLAFRLDQAACRSADLVLLDAHQHVVYFARTFRLPSDRLIALPVGCNEDLFHPRPKPSRRDPVTRVLYYCTYLPLHGVETVLHAAALVDAEPIHFRLVGSGRTYTRARRLARQLGLRNVAFVPPIPLQSLPDEIAAADICLGGHFGQSPKAGRVIPGKVYQILAMARPLIASDTPANRELLSHGETAYLTPPAHPQALAAAILTLHRDEALRHALAVRGRALYEQCCSEAVITARLREIVHRITG